MFKHKYYDSALMCFEKAEAIEYLSKAKAYCIAEKCSPELQEVERELN